MSKYNKAELENLIINKDLSYETVGRMYGVTGAAIKKAAKHLGVKLPKRRKINKCEDFYKKNCKRSKIDNFSDDEFVKIIQSNAGWKNIGVAFGYTNLLSSNI